MCPQRCYGTPSVNQVVIWKNGKIRFLRITAISRKPLILVLAYKCGPIAHVWLPSTGCAYGGRSCGAPTLKSRGLSHYEKGSAGRRGGVGPRGHGGITVASRASRRHSGRWCTLSAVTGGCTPRERCRFCVEETLGRAMTRGEAVPGIGAWPQRCFIPSLSSALFLDSGVFCAPGVQEASCIVKALEK
jgi:hypothetical protein